ncbi:MAG: hypothetical protein K6G42_08320 [Lachnospiraceae bacterium]|nr:hypothetical protein [Lachnospiraceae bacterium]
MNVSFENNKIMINSRNIVLYDVLEKIDEDIKRLKLEKKDGMHLRLLAEETLGMLKTITGQFMAYLWFEKKDNEIIMHLNAKTGSIDIDKKKELINVSSSGKNEYAKGIMGKIGDIMENAVMARSDVDDIGLDREFGNDEQDDISLQDKTSDISYAWSLQEYKNELETESDIDVETKRDILEKSIVASLAKDVTVGVRRDTVEMKTVMELKGK